MNYDKLVSENDYLSFSDIDKLTRWGISLNTYRLAKYILFFFADAIIIGICFYAAFFFRFELLSINNYYEMFVGVLPLFLIVKLTFFVLFRLYRFSWRFVGISDLWNVFKALAISELVLFMLIVPLGPHTAFMEVIGVHDLAGFPRSIFVSDFIITFFLMSYLRFSRRFFYEIVKATRLKKEGLRTIIIGVNDLSELILKDLVRNNNLGFSPVCIVGFDIRSYGNVVHGLRVVGGVKRLKRFIKKFKAEAVIIAEPSLDYKVIRNVYSDAKDSGVNTVKIIPPIYDFHKPHINVKDLEDIKIEDLIGRQAVTVNNDEIAMFIKGKTILVTGAGGSIGFEITMQVCKFEPKAIVVVDNDDTELHSVELKIKNVFPKIASYVVIADVKDNRRINEVFETYKPEIVFHAAAYKHVPIMETNYKEAIKTNIFGTYTVAKVAVKFGVDKFVMISTDKAVNPTSIMGATKRMAENICKSLNKCSSTNFVSVRFGNVLGSRGSLLPTFAKQLKEGGPLTVTHRDMERYFMTIPEAVSLVLQASVIGKGGEVLVLDMGSPVKIVKLAEDFIRLNGMEPYRDIDIKITGIRPGEKLFEETLSSEDGTVATKHEKIFVALNGNAYELEKTRAILYRFATYLKGHSVDNEKKTRELLRTYVTHYDNGNAISDSTSGATQKMVQG